MRGRKVPHFMGGSIGPRMEVCGTSCLPILMIPRFHQSNGNIARKRRAWRVQKCIAIVGADTVLTSAGMQSTLFNGDNIGPRMEICGNSGLPIPMVTHMHQSNGYIKRKIRAWRVQKCITLVGAHTVLTSAGPQNTPFHGGLYRAQNGNKLNFGPTNTHGTAFAKRNL